MNLPFVLDVLISVVFIYLILSLLASELQELLTTLLQWRAKHLKDSIENLISGGGSQSIEQKRLNLLVNEIYSDPLIKSVNQEARGVLATGFRALTKVLFPGNRNGAFGRNQSTGPSYIEPETFATVVMERMGVAHLTEKLVELRLEKFAQRILGAVYISGDRIASLGEEDGTGIWSKAMMLGLDLTNDNHFYHLVDTFADIQSDYRSDLATLPLCIDRMAEALDRFIAAYPADADDRIRTLVERVAADKLSLFGADNQRAWVTGGLQPTLADIAAIVDKSSTIYKSVQSRYLGMKAEGESILQRVLDSKAEYLKQCSPEAAMTSSEELEDQCLGNALNDLTPEEYRLYQDYQNYQRIDHALDYLPKSFKDSLGILARRAQTRTQDTVNTVTHFRDEVAMWFDRSMARTSGVYKRNAKGVALIIGLIIAIFTNADTFHIFNRVASDDELRRVVTERATQVSNNNPGSSIDRNVIRQNLNDLKNETRDVLLDIPLPITWNPQNLSQQLDCPYQSSLPTNGSTPIYSILTQTQWNDLYKACLNVDKVPEGPLPFQVMQMIAAKPLGFLRMFSGWWISGVAIAMGAPFWFDLLSKIVNVRNSGSKPKETANK